MDELYRDAKTETPYGKVCQDLLADGKVGQVCIYTCNPFALLYHACSKSEMFFQFLKGIVNNTADGYLDIAVYLDKATPGNNRRPDDGRSMQCLYWTVVEFPGWFISRRNGWIPFGYVLVKDQKEMQLTDTMLVRFLMRRFGVSSDQLSFQGGFGLEGEAGGTDVLIFRVKAFLSIADGEQHNKTFNLKGHFATVPCRICKNCMGRCAYFTDPYLVHVHSEEYEKLDYMSPEELNGLADELKVLAETGRPSALAKREQEVGLKYDPTALLWDLEVRAMLRPPLSFYPDFMHVFFASGGLAQYELNGMILFLEVRYAIEATDVDTWIANVKTPSGMSKISKKFFAPRVVRTWGARIRAFASEVMTAIVLLGFFVDVCIKPQAEAQGDIQAMEYIHCFELLRVIMSILQRGDMADIPAGRVAMQLHHALYKRFYHCIPKLHSQPHIFDFWELWKRLLSCFGPERHHKLMKKVMNFTYRRGPQTTLAYDVRNWISNLNLPELYMPYHLSGKIRTAALCLEMGPYEIIFNAWAATMNTPQGTMAKNDILQYKTSGGMSVGKCCGFARDSSGHNLVAIAIPLCAQDDGSWLPVQGILQLVPAVALVGGVPYFEQNGAFHLLMHAS